MARAARDALQLDLVLMMVASDPPHKQVAGSVPASVRYQMTALACEGEDRIEACGLELDRTGKSYTSDTVLELHRLYPDACLYWIIGSDMLQGFFSWHEPETIAAGCEIVAVPRIGETDGDPEAKSAFLDRFGKPVLSLPPSVPPMSSETIRGRLRAGLPVSKYLDPSVERFCYEEGLYFSEPIRAWQKELRTMIKPSRYVHSCGCMMEAALLADLWNGDPAKAQTAALLHDCAKSLDPVSLEVYAGDDSGIVPVLHAFAGAVLARTRFGIRDSEILRAIRLHTTGDYGMHLLDEILFLADAAEPGRNYPSVEKLRNQFVNGPEASMLYALTESIRHIRNENGTIHPGTLRAIAYYQQKIKQEENK